MDRDAMHFILLFLMVVLASLLRPRLLSMIQKPTTVAAKPVGSLPSSTNLFDQWYEENMKPKYGPYTSVS